MVVLVETGELRPTRVGKLWRDAKRAERIDGAGWLRSVIRPVFGRTAMATGLEMFDALRRMIRHVPAGTEFRINRFDAIDLCKLTVDDLKHRSVDPDVAEKIVPELLRTGDVALLNVVLGVRLGIDRTAPGVIPGEGIRQSAGALKDDPQTLEEMLEELRLIRHGPEAKP